MFIRQQIFKFCSGCTASYVDLMEAKTERRKGDTVPSMNSMLCKGANLTNALAGVHTIPSHQEPMPQQLAEPDVLSCCSSTVFARELVLRGPYECQSALLDSARRIWWTQARLVQCFFSSPCDCSV